MVVCIAETREKKYKTKMKQMKEARPARFLLVLFIWRTHFDRENAYGSESDQRFYHF